MAKKRSTQKDQDALVAYQANYLRYMAGVDTNQSTTLGGRSFLSLGISVPLAFEYLVDINCLPMGLIYQLIGMRASYKTTFAMEVIRWLGLRRGASDFILTEGKFSQPLAYAMCGYPDEEGYTPIKPYASANMKDWQTRVTSVLKMAIGAMDKGFTANGTKYPPGCYAPGGVIVDSIVSQLTETQTKTIEEQGGSDRGFAVHVKAISEWISTTQAMITCRPYVLLLINHCTAEELNKFITVYKEKGGNKLAFQSSLIIVMQAGALQRTIIDAPGWAPTRTEVVIKLSLNKSSIGDSTRTIVVPIRTETQIMEGVPESMRVRQRTHFRWGDALMRIITSYMAGEASVIVKKDYANSKSRSLFQERILAVTPFKQVTKDTYVCEKYGMTEPVDAETLGCAMQKDPEFVRMFRDIFGIKSFDIWPIGEDFATYLQSCREKLYNSRLLIPD